MPTILIAVEKPDPADHAAVEQFNHVANVFYSDEHYFLLPADKGLEIFSNIIQVSPLKISYKFSVLLEEPQWHSVPRNIVAKWPKKV